MDRRWIHKQLYQEVILDHNKKPRNYGKLEDATHRSEGLNPLCGDHIWLAVKLGGDRIESIAFEGQSCAICKASASMMTASVKGKSVAEAETLVEEFRAMATGQAGPRDEQPNHLGRLTVFAGVKDLPSRVKCAILPWHTLHAAVNAEVSTTTEGDADPVALAATIERHAQDRRNRADAESERDEVRAQGAAHVGRVALLRLARAGRRPTSWPRRCSTSRT